MGVRPEREQEREKERKSGRGELGIYMQTASAVS